MSESSKRVTSGRGKIAGMASALLKAAGYLFTAASITYLLYALEQYSWNMPDNWLGKFASIWFPFSVTCYVASVICGFMIWQYLLKFDRLSLPVSSSAHIYFVAQIGKYLPGNIAQHAGRVVLASKKRLPVATTSKFIIIEQIVVVLSASAFVFVICIFDVNVRERVVDALRGGTGSIAAAVVVSIVAIAALLIFLSRVARYKDLTRRFSSLRYLSMGQLAVLVGLAFTAFVVLGMSLQVLLEGCLQLANVGLLTCIVWATTSWLIGFLTPGSPAGLGVREVILISLISADFGQSTALEAALAFRGISIIGDLAILAMGLAGGLHSRLYPEPHDANPDGETRSRP